MVTFPKLFNFIASISKEFLNEFMRISKASDEDFEHDYSELIAEAEQFLKEKGDDKDHDYYPDYVIENQNGDKVIVEVKPYNQTIKPDMTDTIWLKESWIKNLDKWNAAKRFADEHNMKFIIVTEKFFE